MRGIGFGNAAASIGKNGANGEERRVGDTGGE